jgi:hypothetical protein
MRKIVLFVGLVICSFKAVCQKHDTTTLKYVTIDCFGIPVPDTMASMALVLYPDRRYKSVTKNYWNTKATIDKTVKIEVDPQYQDKTIQESPDGTKVDTIPAYERFSKFNSAVLKGNIKKDSAQKAFKELFHYINHWLFLRSQIDLANGWFFPLKGYNYHAIGGNGDGYSDKGYRYLDGNKHGAHPAHDIFIADKNQDCIDDHTHKPVDVLAVDFGIVIACSNSWDTTSNLRGGKYIWIYHYQTTTVTTLKNQTSSPITSSVGILTYYAHNNAIFVKPGDTVKPGQKIAEVGRTGYNAYKKRSPTHLHFSAFHLVDDLPVPFNPYQQLKKANTL